VAACHWSLPHPKALHSACSLLCAVCRTNFFVAHPAQPQSAVEFILQHPFFRFSLCTIWPHPDTYPSFVTTLLASWPMPHPKMSCTLFHVLYPFSRCLFSSWPLPCPKTFCTSYYTHYPVFRISLPAISSLPHPKRCALYITYFTLFSGPI
jgi:hypothetical protein